MHLRNNKHTSPQKGCAEMMVAETTTTATTPEPQAPRLMAKSLATKKTPKNRAPPDFYLNRPLHKRLRAATPSEEGDEEEEEVFWTPPSGTSRRQTTADTPCPKQQLGQRRERQVAMRYTTPVMITDESEVEDADQDNDHNQGEIAKDHEVDDDDDDDDEVMFVRENVVTPTSARTQYADKHLPPPPPPPPPSQLTSIDATPSVPRADGLIDPTEFIKQLLQTPEFAPLIFDVLRKSLAGHEVQQDAATGFVQHRFALRDDPHHHHQVDASNAQATQDAPASSQVSSMGAQHAQPGLITPTDSFFGSFSSASPSSQTGPVLASSAFRTPSTANTSSDIGDNTGSTTLANTLPPTIWAALEEDMSKYPSVDDSEQLWRMGIQFGIGAGIQAFRQALEEEQCVASQGAERIGLGSSSLSSPATQDLSVAARAGKDVLWSRQRVVDALCSGGVGQHVRESGGFIRACSLLEASSSAGADGAAAVAAGGPESTLVMGNMLQDEPVSYTAGGEAIGGIDMRRLDGTAGLAARMLLEHEMDLDEAL